MKAASDDEPEAAIFMSIFFVKIGLISICSKQDVRHPVGGSAYLFTDSFQVNSGVAFNNQFVMNVLNDKAVPECLHSIAENVTADGLNDVFYELRTVGFDAFPFFCGAHAFICDGFSAELICADSRFHICKSASGRKLNEEHSTFVSSHQGKNRD